MIAWIILGLGWAGAAVGIIYATDTMLRQIAAM